MILVGLLTTQQYHELNGQLYAPDSYFNPILDADLNWVISTQEIEFCTVEEFQWVKQLQLIEFKPKYDSVV